MFHPTIANELGKDRYNELLHEAEIERRFKQQAPAKVAPKHRQRWILNLSPLAKAK